MSLIIFFLSLSVLVLFHELGHYCVARCFNVAVETFSIGFGPALWQRIGKKNHTEFRLSPILLGGYVRFSEEKKEVHAGQHLIHEISLMRQIAILLAGPFANLLLAFLALLLFFRIGSYSMVPYIGSIEPNAYATSVGLKTGQKIIAVNDTPVQSWDQVLTQMRRVGKEVDLTLEIPQTHERSHVILKNLQTEAFFEQLGMKPMAPNIPAVIGKVLPDSPAQKAGLQPGDEVIEMNGIKIKGMAMLSDYVRKHPNEAILLSFKRKGQIQQIKLFSDRVHENQKVYGQLGVSSLGFEHYPQWFVYERSSWPEAFEKTGLAIHHFVAVQLKAWMHLHDQVGQISGPVGIYRAANEAWTVGLKMYLMYIVWLNIGLAVVNLLPIPILDGGQCLLLILRKLFPRFFNAERHKLILLWSLILIAGLFVMGLFNDLSV